MFIFTQIIIYVTIIMISESRFFVEYFKMWWIGGEYMNKYLITVIVPVIELEYDLYIPNNRV